MKNSSDLAAASTPKPVGIAYLIGRLDHALNRRMRDSLSALGLTVSQYTTLSFLSHQGQLSNAQLAERSLTSPQSVNEMVKMMEGKGWLEREPDPSHGRIIHIRLTAAGQTLLQHCDAAVATLEQVMLAQMDEAQREQFQEQLKGLIRMLSSVMI